MAIEAPMLDVRNELVWKLVLPVVRPTVLAEMMLTLANTHSLELVIELRSRIHRQCFAGGDPYVLFTDACFVRSTNRQRPISML